jgi:hypothetical protein
MASDKKISKKNPTDKEILKSWKKFVKEYKPINLTPAEKLRFEELRLMEEMSKLSLSDVEIKA